MGSLEQLEVLQPKNERSLEEEVARRKPGGSRDAVTASVVPSNSGSVQNDMSETVPEQLAEQCRQLLLDIAPNTEADVAAYLAGVWTEAEDLDEAGTLVAETLEAHGVSEEV